MSQVSDGRRVASCFECAKEEKCVMTSVGTNGVINKQRY